MANRLNCPFFHPDMAKMRKSDVLEGLQCGSERTVVATTASGLGVDVPDIRTVIHVGTSDSLRDYAQESGRAGRDGWRSHAIVFDRRVGQESYREGEKTGQGGRDEMRAFLFRQTCRRIVLHQYLDGSEDRVECRADQGESECEHCRKMPFQAELLRQMEEREISTVEEQVSQREQEEEKIISSQALQDAEMADSREDLQRYLQHWASKCAIFHARGTRGPRVNHATRHCQQPGALEVQGLVESMRQSIRYERYSCCFECGVPQWICEHFEGCEDGGWRRDAGKRCQFGKVLIEEVVAVMQDNIDGLRAEIQTEMIRDGVEVENGIEVEPKLQANQLTVRFYKIAKALER